MAHRATRHVRLLRQLKCLTASKNLQQVSELYIYDALNLLSCMTLDVKNIQFIFLHHKGKLFMVLDYPKDFGNAANAANAAKEGLQKKNPLGGVLFHNFKFFVPFTRTCHNPVDHTSNFTVTT